MDPKTNQSGRYRDSVTVKGFGAGALQCYESICQVRRHQLRFYRGTGLWSFGLQVTSLSSVVKIIVITSTQMFLVFTSS